MALYKKFGVKYVFIFIFYIVKFFLNFCDFLAPYFSALKFRALVKNAGISCSCHYSVEIKYPNNIKIGNRTVIGPKSTLGGYGGITIGNNVVVSKGVLIESAGLDFRNKEVPYIHKAKLITIEDEVWIGANAMILGGVTIGKGSIIGAGAVVSKSIPTNSIVVQSPVRVFEK